MLFNWQMYGDMGDSRLALFLAAVLSFLMLSRVRFSKFPLLSFKKGRSNNLRLVALFIVLITLILFKGLILFPLMAIYISWSIIHWMIDHDRFEADANVRTRQEDLYE